MYMFRHTYDVPRAEKERLNYTIFTSSVWLYGCDFQAKNKYKGKAHAYMHESE